MSNQVKGSEIKFGFRQEEGVAITRIAPDGEGFPWFEDTGEVAPLEGLEEAGKAERSVGGSCIDTAEYISPAADIVQELLVEAPQEAKLAVVGISSATGTRTWQEDVSLTFYK